MNKLKEFLIADADNFRPLRLRVLRPVYSRELVNESAHRFLAKRSISSSRQLYDMFSDLTHETREHFLALHLDSKNKILCLDRISVGSLNASIVHPREVFKSTLLSSAAAIAFIHNHPSGNPTPSREDLEITSRLNSCGELLGIRVLDHVIIGDGEYVSLADQGVL